MKTQSLTTGLVLLSAAFFLGCQDLAPTTPEAQPTVLMEVAAPVAVNAFGIVVSINRAEKHGVIERTDDDSHTLYQFSIPGDVDGSATTPEVGVLISFRIDPENSRHATNVGAVCFPPCGGV